MPAGWMSISIILMLNYLSLDISRFRCHFSHAMTFFLFALPFTYRISVRRHYKNANCRSGHGEERIIEKKDQYSIWKERKKRTDLREKKTNFFMVTCIVSNLNNVSNKMRNIVVNVIRKCVFFSFHYVPNCTCVHSNYNFRILCIIQLKDKCRLHFFEVSLKMQSSINVYFFRLYLC